MFISLFQQYGSASPFNVSFSLKALHLLPNITYLDIKADKCSAFHVFFRTIISSGVARKLQKLGLSAERLCGVERVRLAWGVCSQNTVREPDRVDSDTEFGQLANRLVSLTRALAPLSCFKPPNPAHICRLAKARPFPALRCSPSNP